MLLLLASALASAADLRVEVHPTGHPAMVCTATSVVLGDLLAAPTVTMGEARVTPLIEVAGAWAGRQVYWRTALKVVQPGLISIARTDDRQDPAPCPLGQACGLTFHRDEQTVGLSVTFAGAAPERLLQERPRWDSTSWYREPRALDCAPLSP